MTDYTVHLLTENFTALASEVSVMVDGKMEYSFDEADGLREDSFYSQKNKQFYRQYHTSIKLALM